MEVPSRDALRQDLAAFDETDKKIVGGVLAVMFESPDKIRDPEWISEQFTQVALLTGQFETVDHAHDGVEAAQAWIRVNLDRILNACFALFVHVAEDMQASHPEGGFAPSDAMVQALGYFG